MASRIAESMKDHQGFQPQDGTFLATAAGNILLIFQMLSSGTTTASKGHCPEMEVDVRKRTVTSDWD